MLYAAMTFWLLVVIFVAWAVHQLWSSMVRPRVVNSILLPGTLLAQLGRVMGLLISGGTVNNTTLMRDDEAGEPETDHKARSKIPVLGPVLVAMLPLLACAAGVYLATRELGGDILVRVSGHPVAQTLPLSVAAFWGLLRDTITLVERIVNAMTGGDLIYWRTVLFMYLVVCLTVRMAPLPGNLRGSLGAIVLLGVLAAVMGSALPAAARTVQNGWVVLTFSVGVLLLLLVVSLLVRGAVGLIKVLAKEH